MFDVIGTTYGAGDGSATFNLPNLVDKFVEGSATAGTVKNAGLPNITGHVVPSGYRLTDAYVWGGDGALSNYGTDTIKDMAGVSSTNVYNQPRGISIDASRSSSIYGNSTTVQPPALTMKYAIYSGVVTKKLWLRTV